MTAHYYVIAFLVLIIIIVQISVFIKTHGRIKSLEYVFTGRETYSIASVEAPVDVADGPVPRDFRSFIRKGASAAGKTFTVDFTELVRYDGRRTFARYGGIFVIYYCRSSDADKEKPERIDGICYIGESQNIDEAVKAYIRQSDWKKIKDPVSELFIASAKLEDEADRERVVYALRKSVNHEHGMTGEADQFPGTTVRIEGYRLVFPEEYSIKDNLLTRITLLNFPEDSDDVFTGIIQSINSYLFRNKGHVNDFRIIRDIVDRNVEALDEVINNQLPIPLYLGLLGTMLGIIIGVGVLLFVGIGELATDTGGISVLLGGVAIAMGSSFIGLLLTVLSTGLFYRKAKIAFEAARNDFYSWIQEELMPGLTRDFASGIKDLQLNLDMFNATFSSNVAKFSDSLDQITPVISAQASFISEIKGLDVEKMAGANVAVLKQLDYNVDKIRQFGEYVDRLSSTIGNIESLNRSISMQIERTSDFQTIAKDIRKTLTLNENILEAINPISKEIGERKLQLQKAVISIDDSMTELLDDLKQKNQQKLLGFQQQSSAAGDSISTAMDVLQGEMRRTMAAFTEFTREETAKMETIIAGNPGLLEELKKLGDLHSEMKTLNRETALQKSEVAELKASLSGLHSTIKENSVPKPIRILGIAFLAIGAAIGIGFILHVLIQMLR